MLRQRDGRLLPRPFIPDDFDDGFEEGELDDFDEEAPADGMMPLGRSTLRADVGRVGSTGET